MYRISSKVFVAGVVAAIGAAAVAVVLVHDDREPLPSVAPLARPGGTGAGPCASGGEQIALSDAPNRTDARVMIPEHALANRNNVREVWICGGLKIEFDSGLRLLIGENEIRDPSATFARWGKEDPLRVSVGVVRGVPASLTDPDVGRSRTEGGVWLILGRWHYIVEGRGQASLSELKAVAESLRDYDG